MNDVVDIPQPSPTETGIQNMTLDQQLGLLMKDVNLSRNPTSHVHKNDEGYGLLLSEISDHVVTTDRIRVGLVVGNGAILSSLPDIPADTVIISDYNPFIHEWTQFTANALNQTNSPDEYRKLTYSDQNPLYQELRAQRQDQKMD